MHATIAAKIIAGLMIPCLILFTVGCYSYQDVALKEAKTDEHLIVGTDGGRYFRLAAWTADSLGNISGRGAEYATLEDARDLRDARQFKGTIPADSIAVLQADQPDHRATTGLVVGIIVSVLLICYVAALNIDYFPHGLSLEE